MENKSMQKKGKIPINLFVKGGEEFSITIWEQNAQSMDIVKPMAKLIIKRRSNSYPMP
jgi:hypothetical protein